MGPLTAPSFWLETCGEPLVPRPALPGDMSVDVAIVGAGYTGLWAAHHLLRLDPSLRVVVLERRVAGWGASGRNGGWCSALYPVATSPVMYAELRRTVDDIGRWCEEYAVDAHFVKGGTLTLARNEAHLASLPPDQQRLTAEEVTQRLNARDVLGGVYTPHCASVHPGRLVRGLARIVEGQGAAIHESTAVTELRAHRVTTDRGSVTADVVLRATEAYTAELPGSRRAMAPVWSLVIATEPLPEQIWDEIGWGGRETVTDGRHLIIYAQRTRDDRIVIGGRGAPYRFGSKTAGTAGHARTHRQIEAAMHDLLPATRTARVTHRWGGVLGMPRDFTPSVRFDRSSGLGSAGGYVGDGVAASWLAGRTLADLVLARDTDLTRLPWVQHRSRQWEPEPLRWLGIRGMTTLMSSADRVEQRTGRRARRTRLLDRLTGSNVHSPTQQ